MIAPPGDCNPATVWPHGSSTSCMQQLLTGLLKLPGRLVDCSGIGNVELDADLRYRALCRPPVGPETRLSSLGERPDPERLAAGDLLAVVVAVTLALQRES
jgi:hypothetical protein